MLVILRLPWCLRILQIYLLEGNTGPWPVIHLTFATSRGDMAVTSSLSSGSEYPSPQIVIGPGGKIEANQLIFS